MAFINPFGGGELFSEKGNGKEQEVSDVGVLVGNGVGVKVGEGVNVEVGWTVGVFVR